MSDLARIRDEAAAWAARLRERDASSEEREEFSAWLQRSPDHAPAYENAAQTWKDLATMRQHGRYRQLLGAPTFRERLVDMLRAPRWVQVTVAALVVVTLAAVLRVATLANDPSRVVTRVAEVRDVLLPDGTRVTLGAQSQFRYELTAEARRATLVGDAFFSVAKDPARPFYVSSGEVRVKVLGTQFEVRGRADDVSVAVVEGVVQVLHEGSPQAEARTLRRGDSFTSRQAARDATVRTVEADDVAAWRSGRLVYDDIELQEVLADANRYTGGSIVVEDPRLARTHVTTSFHISKVDELLETLHGALGVEIERREDGSILLRPRR